MSCHVLPSLDQQREETSAAKCRVRSDCPNTDCPDEGAPHPPCLRRLDELQSRTVHRIPSYRLTWYVWTWTSTNISKVSLKASELLQKNNLKKRRENNSEINLRRWYCYIHHVKTNQVIQKGRLDGQAYDVGTSRTKYPANCVIFTFTVPLWAITCSNARNKSAASSFIQKRN